MSRGDSGRNRRGRSSKRGRRDKRSGNNINKSNKSSKTTTFMTIERARAIQSHADRTGRNQDFKSRAMSASVLNEELDD